MFKFAYILLLLFPLILIAAGIFLLKVKRALTLRTRLTSLFLIVFTGPTILLTVLSILLGITTLRTWTAPRFQNTLEESIELAREYRTVLGNNIASYARMIDKSGKPEVNVDSLICAGDIHVAIRRSGSGEMKVLGVDTSYTDLAETAIHSLTFPAPSLDASFDGARVVLEEIRLGDELLLAAIVPSDSNDSEIITGRIMEKSYVERIKKLTGMAGDSGRFRFLYSRGGERLIWILAVAWLCIFSVLSVLLSRKIAGSVTAPLNGLVEAASAISEGRFDFKVKEEPGAGDEVSRLIIAFNKMSASLDHTRARLIESQRLASWRDSARKMAHEVKNTLTPLRILVTRFSRISPRPESEAKYFECLDEFDSRIKALSGMATTFSQFARMPELRKIKTDLPLLCETVLSSYRRNLPDVNVKTLYDPALPKPIIDPDQTRRLLVNLCDNAIAAMSESLEKELSVSLREKRGEVILAVSDTGKGIRAEDHDLVFKPYYTGKPQGTGLGLAIVREIADLHGWRIDIESSPGNGAAFSITITPEVNSDALDFSDRR